MLGDLGGHVIDADELARRATAPGEPALGPIRERFGQEVFVVARGPRPRRARRRRLRGCRGPSRPRGDRPPGGAGLGRGRARRGRARRASRSSRSRPSSSSRAAWPTGARRPGSSSASRSSSGSACAPAASPDDDIERRLGAQGEDLATRLVDALGSRPHRRIERVGVPGITPRARRGRARGLARSGLPRAPIGPRRSTRQAAGDAAGEAPGRTEGLGATDGGGDRYGVFGNGEGKVDGCG